MHSQFDDAYMYCRYVSNYLSGYGFSWNASEGPAYGLTSPMHLFLLTAAKSLFPLTSNSSLLAQTSFAAGLLGLLVLVVVGYSYGLETKNRNLPLLIIPFCLLSGMFRYHSFTGMETTLAFAANAFLVLSAVIHSKTGSRASFSLLLLCSVFTVAVRPDNGAYALLFPLCYLYVKGTFSRRSVLLFSVMFSVACGLLLLSYSRLFGSFLPIPYYAKSGEFLVGYAGAIHWNAADYVLVFLRDTSPFVAVTVLFANRKSLAKIAAVLFPVLCMFLYYSTTVQIMGWVARYYFPAYPFLVFAALIALKHRQRLSLKALSVRFFILILVYLPVTLPSLRNRITDLWTDSQAGFCLYRPNNEFVTPAGKALERLSWWESMEIVSAFVQRSPDGVSLAATEYGIISAENLHAEIVDMAGLHDMGLARSGFSSEWILARQPDIIWLPHNDYTWFRKTILDDPRFLADYDYYPDVFNYGVALRRESPLIHFLQAPFDSLFRAAYPGRSPEDYLAVPVRRIPL